MTVALTGTYFLAFALLAWRAPTRVGRFLLGFARSAPTHYLELAVRVTVGAAFVVTAPALRGAPLFRGFGWVLMLTSAGLACVPWASHRRFANWAVPRALAQLPLLGVAALGLGALVLGAVLESVWR